MVWKILLVFLISMIPLIELRGAIPVAIGMDLGLPEWLVLIIAIIGNIIPIPIIYLFARKVLNWGSTKCKWKWFKNFCVFCLKKGEKAGNKLLKKVKGGVYWALFLFVAVPIPGGECSKSQLQKSNNFYYRGDFSSRYHHATNFARCF